MVKKNDGSGGVDGKEFVDYNSPEQVDELINERQNELVEGIYKSEAVLWVYIPMPDGKERHCSSIR